MRGECGGFGYTGKGIAGYSAVTLSLVPRHLRGLFKHRPLGFRRQSSCRVLSTNRSGWGFVRTFSRKLAADLNPLHTTLNLVDQVYRASTNLKAAFRAPHRLNSVTRLHIDIFGWTRSASAPPRRVTTLRYHGSAGSLKSASVRPSIPRGLYYFI